ncbi:aldehyde dehydrogenase [Bimuria novae-zelandiae CBS 107.79]|uniref:aldehyde dehydrogenase (NAD(+)) n=1 Tax=Bimuria novae-zelandiae CBS 107.79 TaxID=1447943 RepID=A0A6A5UVA3_9PLEO|nr:aldehyde dehydrogenase [Bimuria novae-zelandiae CBS 107.79]
MGLPEHIETRLFINGEFVESSEGKTFDITNPATLKLVAEVHEASEQDTDRAVASARAAFPAWSALSPAQRAPYLKKLASLIRENIAELAALEAASMGKPVGEFFEGYAAAGKFDYYSEAGHLIQGTTSVQTPGFLNMTLRQPYGVVAAIIPWNVPLLFLSNKVAPALIVGNTVVLKSSEKAPLTSAKLATLIQQAGFPPGVFNIITGFGNVSGSILSHHMDVRALSFTGSGRTGRLIQAAAAKSNLKAVFLELGGKSPAVVFEDADLAKAVQETGYSFQNNSGQVCMMNSRIYVQDTVFDKYIELFREYLNTRVKIGNPLEQGITHGPQADEAQHKAVLRYLELGKKSGDLLVGGSALSDREGYYVQPTVFTNTPEDAQIMKEEVFGPVVNINVFKTEEEVLAKANDTEFGLYAAVYTKDISRALRFAKGLEAGTVGINCTSPTTGVNDTPFGGYKSSGTGREGEPFTSLNNYLETKSSGAKMAEASASSASGLQPMRGHGTHRVHSSYGRLVGEVKEGEPIPRDSEETTPDEVDEPLEAEPVLDSVNDLHESLGTMMLDSTGRYRYVGAHSEIPFNAVVCTKIGREAEVRRDPRIIATPKVGLYPPPFPTTSSTDAPGSPGRAFFLPRRELCDYYVSRFLADVHSTHWFYSIEQFLYQVDSTYTGKSGPPSTSWMCSLYAILSLGAANYDEPSGQSPLPPGSPAASDVKSSEDYIVLAKELIPAVYDEADLDSIRALAIMSIALENLCSRTTSYLYMGASIQMAYSIGLHRDSLTPSVSSMEREQNRRIWWTLFTLDLEIASRGGSPTLIDERYLRITTPLPSEQILYPGMHTPLSWLSTSVSLCRLKREIIQAVYTERFMNSRTVSCTTISKLLLSLQGWHQLMPPHLKPDVPTPSTHKRAVAVLHLQYWSTIMLLCRPFLLYLVLKHSTMEVGKKIWFERMGKTCIDAAQKSLNVLEQMARDNTLSSLTSFDSTCLLRLVMVFILAFVHTKMPQYRSHIETSNSLMKSMEQIGFSKMVAEETPIRLADLGIPIETNEGNTSVLLDDDLIAQLWGNLDGNFMTPLQTQQSLDLAIDDTNYSDLNSDMLQMTNLDDSIVIDAHTVYSGYDYR